MNSLLARLKTTFCREPCCTNEIIDQSNCNAKSMKKTCRLGLSEYRYETNVYLFRCILLVGAVATAFDRLIPGLAHDTFLRNITECWMYPKSSKVTQTQHLYASAFSESFYSLITFERTVARSQSSANLEVNPFQHEICSTEIYPEICILLSSALT